MTVLVVDDEESLRRVMIRQLQAVGYRCFGAGNAAQARAMLEEHDIDLLITDVNMPGESGITLLRQVNDKYDLATILLTGVESSELAAGVMQLGVYGYLFKPVSALQLQVSAANAIARLLIERDLRNDVAELEEDLEDRDAEIARISQELAAAPSGPSVEDPSAEAVDYAQLVVELQSVLGQSLAPVPALAGIRLRGLPQLRRTLSLAELEAVFHSVLAALGEQRRPLDTLARMGPGEFAMILSDPMSRTDPMAAAERLVRAVTDAQIPGADGRPVSVDIGVTTVQEDVSQTLRAAAVACFEASRDRTAHVSSYTAVPSTLRGRMDLHTDLVRAIDAGEIVPYFQPVVDVESDEIVGLEVTPRWHHPTRGILLNTLFMPLAREMSVADEITLSLIRRSCAALASWGQPARDRRPLWVSVDVYPEQLMRGYLGQELARTLERCGVPPRQLLLEINEASLSSQADVMRAHMQALQSVGVRLMVDEFGAGALSVHLLHDLPIDAVKLARMLMESSGYDNDSGGLLTGAVELVHSLGLPVIAQGVERSRQLDVLRAAGAEFGQGHYLCGPLDTDAVDVLLTQQNK